MDAVLDIDKTAYYVTVSIFIGIAITLICIYAVERIIK